MKIDLPNENGKLSPYILTGEPIETAAFDRNFNRVVFSAAHVVADPFAANRPVRGRGNRLGDDDGASAAILLGLGLGIAEAMDTAQRGMGLDWPQRHGTHPPHAAGTAGRAGLQRLPAPTISTRRRAFAR